jgi:hypothetical protein
VRQPLQNYGLIGWIASGIAIACIGLAARPTSATRLSVRNPAIVVLSTPQWPVV